MSIQNPRAVVGGNNPPDPIQAVLAEYDGIITEAQNWADGEPVTDEASMLALDKVIKEFKTYRTALTKAGKERTDPAHKAWKAEVAAVKVYTDDADKMQGCLVACVAPYKAKLAAEKEEARKQAAMEAARKQREAQEAADAANAADIDAQREAQAKLDEAKAATVAASAAKKDTVKGMRTVKQTVVLDRVKLARYLWEHDLEEQLIFQADRARKLGLDIPGVVEIRTKKEAY